MTIPSFPYHSRIELLALVGLALATSGCVSEVEETTVPSEAEVRDSSLTIAIDDDGHLFVPQFHDVERYHDGVHIAAGGAFSIENRGQSPRRIVVKFDGPPMLDQHHEIHTSRTVELAPSQSSKLRAPDSRGRYRFQCPTGDSTGEPCHGLSLADGSGEWTPFISVGGLF